MIEYGKGKPEYNTGKPEYSKRKPNTYSNRKPGRGEQKKVSIRTANESLDIRRDNARVLQEKTRLRPVRVNQRSHTQRVKVRTRTLNESWNTAKESLDTR